MRLQKYQQFRGKGFAKNSRQDDVNNAFFNWQLTHDAEQEEDGPDVWPELYRDSRDFQELKRLVKLSSPNASLSSQSGLSVTPPNQKATTKTSMCLAFHDHPLALLSGAFYADAGGRLGCGPHPDGFCRPSWNDALPLHADA